MESQWLWEQTIEQHVLLLRSVKMLRSRENRGAIDHHWTEIAEQVRVDSRDIMQWTGTVTDVMKGWTIAAVFSFSVSVMDSTACTSQLGYCTYYDATTNSREHSFCSVSMKGLLTPYIPVTALYTYCTVPLLVCTVQSTTITFKKWPPCWLGDATENFWSCSVL